MFPVNVMPKHQRLERIGHKNSEQSFTVNERKKKKEGDLLVDTQKQTGLSGRSEQR